MPRIDKHATISITLDKYSHVTTGLQQAAALRFEEGLLKPAPVATEWQKDSKMTNDPLGKMLKGSFLRSKPGAPGGTRTLDPWFRRLWAQEGLLLLLLIQYRICSVLV